MRQLRFVRVSDDAAHLVVAAVDGGELFALAAEPALRAAVATLPPIGTPHPVEAPARHAAPIDQVETAVAPRTDIGPREIQIRVRGGESPQALADSLGVPLERIQRFAAPVVDERLRIADEARRARARRSVPEGSESKVVVFGEAVDDRFAAHGIAPADVSWDSYRTEDGTWIVQAEWIGGDDVHTAEWVFQRSSRTVTPLDETATDLLSDRPIRPITPVAEPVRPSLVSAPPLAPGVVAFPPMPDAHTGQIPRYEDVFDQEAAPDGPRDVPPLVPAVAELEFDAPPLPLAITDPSTRPAAAAGPSSAVSNLTRIQRPKESDEDRAARSRIPSWDDILLGVRRKD